jgi:recombination protein RecR
MAKAAESIGALAAEFAKMPGIGKRTAERLAYYVQAMPMDDAKAMVDAMRNVKARAKTCSVCCNITESDPCPVCSDRNRDQSIVCVVETVRDLAVIESNAGYRGVYHVLGGHIAPLEDVHPEDLSIRQLVRRVKKGGVKEVVIATNPDTEGDSTANFLVDHLAPLDVTVSVLARGVPAGGQIEHAARGTLAGAMSGRRNVNAK